MAFGPGQALRPTPPPPQKATNKKCTDVQTEEYVDVISTSYSHVPMHNEHIYDNSSSNRTEDRGQNELYISERKNRRKTMYIFKESLSKASGFIKQFKDSRQVRKLRKRYRTSQQSRNMKTDNHLDTSHC